MTSHCHGESTQVIDGDLHLALVGNPNAGKSTLFNALTGLNAKTANYPGVTVSRAVGSLQVDGRKIVVEDLPGTYSLDPISPDERIVADALDPQGDLAHPGAALVILDATSLKRSLGLLAQVQQTGLPTLVVLSFGDELARRGGSINIPALAKAVGQTVLPVTAGDRNQLHELKQVLTNPVSWDTPVVPAPTEPDALTGWIDSVLESSGWRAPQVDERTRKIDTFLLHPVLGSVIFFVTMLIFFQMIFTVAAPIQDLIDGLFGSMAEWVGENITTDWLSSLLADGLIAGVGGVLVFLPQIALLFLMISILEGTGYMSRVAFLMDRIMGKAGLEGRAFVAMLSSVACAIPGIMSTRSLPSARDRLATMMTAPLMTCSARLPVYTLLIAMLVPDDVFYFGVLSLQGLVMFAMYLLGVVATMGAAWVFKHILKGKGPSLPFYMEMPSYRLPRLSEIGHSVWEACWAFISRVGGIILVLSLILWALLNLPMISEETMEANGVDTSDEVAVATYQLDNSVAASVGKAIQPVFEPLGFDWRIAVGLIGAMGAREVFVATLGQIASAEDPEDPMANLEEMTWLSGPHEGEPLFTPAVIAALLVYFAFAMQCTSTIAILRRESGTWRWPLIAFGYMTALAWIFGLVTKLIVGALVG